MIQNKYWVGSTFGPWMSNLSPPKLPNCPAFVACHAKRATFAIQIVMFRKVMLEAGQEYVRTKEMFSSSPNVENQGPFQGSPMFGSAVLTIYMHQMQCSSTEINSLLSRNIISLTRELYAPPWGVGSVYLSAFESTLWCIVLAHAAPGRPSCPGRRVSDPMELAREPVGWPV